MCIEAKHELLALTGVNTASRHRDPTPAVLQIKIHIDFIWLWIPWGEKGAWRSFLSESAGGDLWSACVIDTFIILHMLPQQIYKDKHCTSINAGTDDETTKELQGESRLTRFFTVLK